MGAANYGAEWFGGISHLPLGMAGFGIGVGGFFFCHYVAHFVQKAMS